MPTLWVHAFRDGRLERSLPLSRAEATVGSRAFCDLVLSGPDVDPLHARLVRAGDDVTLVFERGGRRLPLAPDQPVHLASWSLTLEVRADLAVAPRLDRVLELWARLAQREDEASAFQELLESLVNVFAADFGAFVDVSDPAAPRVLYGAGKSPERTTVSHTVIEQVTAERAPVAVADVTTDPSLSQAESIPVHVRSVIAAPLTAADRLAGILYLESPESRGLYSDQERDLLGKICALVGDHLTRARRARELAADNLRLGALQKSREAAGASLSDLVGSGQAMRRVLEQVRQVARTDVTTLILGESGTGKELLAKAIHQLSGRRESPFVPVNCMALPEDLVESELFGHARGAFSGATADRLGRFEMAHRGTLFLDEVGELSLKVQVKLLRVLEERVIQRLGEGRDRAVDVRLVAATNAPLADSVARGSFRDDLYYRLSVFVITLPPLRDRLEDLPLLVDHFIRTFNHTFKRRVRGLDPGALDLCGRHRWPGNVRELRNVIEAAFVREQSEWITPESLSLLPAVAPVRSQGQEPDWPDGLEAARNAFERRHIVKLLEAERGVVPAVVKRLAVSRSNFYKKCAALGIDPERYRR